MPTVARLDNLGNFYSDVNFANNGFDEVTGTQFKINSDRVFVPEMDEVSLTDVNMRQTKNNLFVEGQFIETRKLNFGITDNPPATTTDAIIISHTGSSQTFTVPLDVSWLKVTCNGAGGGKGDDGPNGGAGGRLSAWIPVEPDETFTVVVGGAGASSNGFGGIASRFGGGGGGFTGLLRSNGDHVISAGGGGGSSINRPVTLSNTALSNLGGYILVYSNTSPSGGLGGIANSAACTAAALSGANGTSVGGGAGGNTMITTISFSDAGGGGGGGGFGTDIGQGGQGADGGGVLGRGRGGNGGYGGGGGGGGGGVGSTPQRTDPGGGGGGGYLGGQGGLNTIQYLNRHGQGGANFLYWTINPRSGQDNLVIQTLEGNGSVGQNSASATPPVASNGSMLIEW